MLGTIVRYGIVALAAALATLTGGEAAGCRRCHCRHACRRHHCGRCCPCQAAMMGAYATFGMNYGVGGPAVAAPLFAQAMLPPRRPRTVAPPRIHPGRPPVVVPPGTLGYTYHQISRLVPETEHPRTGMIDICSVPPGMQVTIAGMEGYRGLDGVWHFRSVRPLLPCRPTIRTAYLHSPLGVPVAGVNYRAFRLIPGRIVSLRW